MFLYKTAKNPKANPQKTTNKNNYFKQKSDDPSERK